MNDPQQDLEEGIDPSLVADLNAQAEALTQALRFSRAWTLLGWFIQVKLGYGLWSMPCTRKFSGRLAQPYSRDTVFGLHAIATLPLEDTQIKAWELVIGPLKINWSRVG